MSILDLQSFARTPLQRDPCDFIVVPEFVRRDVLDEINRDYPGIDEPGNFPPEELQYGPSFAALLAELVAAGIRVKAFAEVKQTVEDLYMKLSRHEVM